MSRSSFFSRISTVDAATITQTFNYSGDFASSSLFAPFDTALGTLNSVNLSFDGLLQATINTPPQIAGFGTPFPYAWSGLLKHSMLTPGANSFSMAPPSIPYVITGVAAGDGVPSRNVLTYSYDMAFDPLTDLTGFTLATLSGPVTTSWFTFGRMSDFANAVPIPQLMQEFWEFESGNFIGPTVSALSLFSTGTLQIDYDYTAVDPLSLEEPASGLMLLLGVAGMMVVRRQRAGRDQMPDASKWNSGDS